MYVHVCMCVYIYIYIYAACLSLGPGAACISMRDALNTHDIMLTTMPTFS
jgi:hypothetical protein